MVINQTGSPKLIARAKDSNKAIKEGRVIRIWKDKVKKPAVRYIDHSYIILSTLKI